MYHPPQAVQDANIAKVTSCDDTFAALSSSGEVFTFSVPSLSEGDAFGKERVSIKPQRVWALRKQFSGVRVCSIIFTVLSLRHLSINIIVGCRPRV